MKENLEKLLQENKNKIESIVNKRSDMQNQLSAIQQEIIMLSGEQRCLIKQIEELNTKKEEK